MGNPIANKGGSGGSGAGAGAPGLSAGQVAGAAAVVGSAAAAGGYAAARAADGVEVDTGAARNAAASAGSTVANALQQAADGVNADGALAHASSAAGEAGEAASAVAATASAEAVQAANYTAHAAAGAAQGAQASASQGASAAVSAGKAFGRQASAAFLPVAGAASGAAGAVASSGKQVVSSTLTTGVAAGTNFWESSMAAGKKLVEFTPPDSMYATSRDTLVLALASAAGAAVSLFSLVKLEVLRDFFQLLSLFIANVATSAMEDAKIVFGNVSSIISLDWSFAIPSINPGVIYAIILVVALILILAYLWAMFQTRSLQMDEIREGKEVKTWDQLAAVSMPAQAP